jgi:hypothetical protein
MAEIQQPSKGYGSYLTGIIPPDIAVAAGAFSAAMQQIQNIQEVQIEKLAQVVTNMETMAGLNTNANSNNLVPTNLPLRTLGRPKIALGSGPQGSYTMSDFFGCMSGLPYNGPLSNIYAKLNEVATRKLFNIYHETYLAVTYQRARMSITQTVYNVMTQAYDPPTVVPPYDGLPRIDDWYYTISFKVDVKGGGYGRGTAPPPNIYITPNNVGASATCSIGTDDTAIPGDFGRVNGLSANFGSPFKYATTSVMQAGPPCAPAPAQEKIYIELPPPGNLPVQPNGDFSTAGTNIPLGYGTGAPVPNGSCGFGLPFKETGPAQWPGMNAPIQQYIDQANAEIDAILLAKPAQCKSLNNSWNATGAQLTIEQRARQEGLRPPLDNGIAPGFGVANPATRENFLSLFPTTIYTFVDSVPQYGKNTEPHMYAQTLENIANWDTIGGQSIVGMMRENRNQSRLTALGISLDNNIIDVLPYDQQKVLIVNGTLPTGLANPNIPSGSVTANTFIPNTTIPSTPVTIIDSVELEPKPDGTLNDAGEYVINNIPIDIGLSVIPGSFAGSPYTDLIPPNLNSWYTSSTLMPSTYTVNEAIDEVVRCNCDCWNLA